MPQNHLLRLPAYSIFTLWVVASLLEQRPCHAMPFDKLDTNTIASSNHHFQSSIKPILKRCCYECHEGSDPEAMFDLSIYGSHEEVAKGFQLWEVVVERVLSHEMPPEEYDAQPTDGERAKLAAWYQNLKEVESQRTAGDPGEVLVRRLNHAEYNRTIRDLTGHDLQPTKTFPIDPANTAGFDNSGESLTMSPALLNKYLAAARFVAEHLVLTPQGIAFAPHPVVTDTDRDKYCVKRIVNFYESLPTDYADYLFAAFKWKHLQNATKSEQNADQTLSDYAITQNLSEKYLNRIWNLLHQPVTAGGPIDWLQTRWNQLPNDLHPSQVENPRDTLVECQAIRDEIQQLRNKLTFEFPNLSIEGGNPGSQPFVLWKNRQYVAHRQLANTTRLRISATDANAPIDSNDTPPQDQITEPAAPLEQLLQLPKNADDREKVIQEFIQFCEVFPDALYLSERGRDYVSDNQKQDGERGRLLSAGFHSMMGYFRDDQPLYELVLNESQQLELDQLWDELNFVTNAPTRQYSGFLWFDRTDSRYMRDQEFDFARPENRAASEEDQIKKLGVLYREKAIRSNAGQSEIEAIDTFFEEINSQIRQVEQLQHLAKAKHLTAITEFAERAYRRPLDPQDEAAILDFYQERISHDLLSHEQAIEDTFVSILMSPYFCYHLELASESTQPESLNSFELANRLSYLLWSSQPDQELLDDANTIQTDSRPLLTKHVYRMIDDPKIEAWATEFGGHWLDFRQFQSHNSVDRERFPQFNSELRQAMFEEPIRLLTHFIKYDRPVTELILGDDTFVNLTLANHYGIERHRPDQEWTHIKNVSALGRGGLLGMAVFQTKNSPGLRTSPVKRGYWVVKQILGERIPPPPPDVPELPDNEAEFGELTIRQSLEVHRNHVSCAGCHQRFDSIGLAFEGYGPIGERRDRDLGGRLIETQVDFPAVAGKSPQIDQKGLQGLKEYLETYRMDQYIDTLCRKLLSYSLGRSLQLSDEPLVSDLKVLCLDKKAGFKTLLAEIVASPQFQTKRASIDIASSQ